MINGHIWVHIVANSASHYVIHFQLSRLQHAPFPPLTSHPYHATPPPPGDCEDNSCISEVELLRPWFSAPFKLNHLQNHWPYKRLCLNRTSLIRPRRQQSRRRGWILFWVLLQMYNTRMGRQQSILSSVAETEKTGRVITMPIRMYKIFWNRWLKATI